MLEIDTGCPEGCEFLLYRCPKVALLAKTMTLLLHLILSHLVFDCLQNVIQGSSSIGTEMAHQLYVLQNLMFNLLDERMMTPIDDNDQVSG